MIQNYSFELGPVGCCQVPPDWENCGSPGETPPDIHCHLCENPFGIRIAAPHGEQFLAMVVRSNGSKECIQQELSTPMIPQKKYRIRIYLGKSSTFNSVDRLTAEPASYAALAGLTLYGMSNTGFVRSLGHIRPFTGSGWTEYNFVFEADKSYEKLIFEAGFLGQGKVYNGHLLMDYIRITQEE